MEQERCHLRKTKIIVTLGISSFDIETLKALILGGMDMARISNRFITEKQQVLDNLKQAVRETGIHVGIMLGLRESDMRIANLKPKVVMHLEEGQIIHITTNPDLESHEPMLYCNNNEFPTLVEPGDRLLVDFGKIVLTVISLECLLDEEHEDVDKNTDGGSKGNIMHRLNTQGGDLGDSQAIRHKATVSHSAAQTHQMKPLPVSPDKSQSKRIKRAPKQEKTHITVICRVEYDAILIESKPLHISTYDNRPQPISYVNDSEDLKNIRWSQDNDVDIVVFKTIRGVDEFVNYGPYEYRRFIGIQNKDSIEISHELISITDGCVIGRGMLALETSLSDVCRVQKDMAAFCNAQAKPMIISTQLLESMITNTVPTRSEVTDITNAVLDGCDALLLSGETAYGAHPLLALQVCSQICLEAERCAEYAQMTEIAMQHPPLRLSVAENICYCAVQSVLNTGAVLIICISEKGGSALMLSKYKPPCPILVLTNSLRTLKYLRIVRGVIPVLMQDLTSHFYTSGVETAKSLNLVKTDDLVVYIGGSTDSFAAGDTCALRVREIKA